MPAERTISQQHAPVTILAIAAHRDDVELTCGGTLIKAAKLGQRTAILDLTQGEMGTRGTAEIRAAEAISSTVTALNPRSWNSRSATVSTSATIMFERLARSWWTSDWVANSSLPSVPIASRLTPRRRVLH